MALNSNRYSVKETANLANNGRFQIAVKGTIGSNLDITPTDGEKEVKQMIINAPFASDNATLKIYKDSVIAGNLLFDGYFANRDKDNSIRFPQGEICITKWIVVTNGGSGDLFILARYG